MAADFVSKLVTPQQIETACNGDPNARTVRRACKTGVFPGAALLGRQWVIPVEEAMEWLAHYERYSHEKIVIVRDNE